MVQPLGQGLADGQSESGHNGSDPESGQCGGGRAKHRAVIEGWTRQREQLQQELRRGSYRPQPARRAWIPKLGSTELRPLGIPAVRDRVVQTAMLAVLEPIFERDFAEQSYGFRPGRGSLQALERVESLLQSGHTWVVDADLKAYFDTIPHERLLALVGQRIADGKVLGLLERYLKAGVMASGKEWQPSEQGTPQGAVISPLLANVYLNPLDHQMAGEGYQMVRYADDFVVWAHGSRSPRGVDGNWAMGGGGGTNAASDQNADRQCGGTRRVRLSGIPFRAIPRRRRQEMAPAKEPVKAAGNTASQAATGTKREHGTNRGRTQSDVTRLVWVFQIQPALRDTEHG